MKTMLKRIAAVALLIFMIGMIFAPQKSFAAEETTAVTAVTDENSLLSSKAWASGIMIAIAAGAGAIAMGFVIAKCAESIAKQPEAEGKIRTTMMLGLVFVETAIIYALIVAILIIFVL